MGADSKTNPCTKAKIALFHAQVYALHLLEFDDVAGLSVRRSRPRHLRNGGRQVSAQRDPSVRSQANAAAGRQAMSQVEELLGSKVDRRQFLSRAAALGLTASSAGALWAAMGSSTAAMASTASGSGSSAKPPTTTLSWRPTADVQNVDPAVLPGLEDPTYSPCFFEGLIAYRPGTDEVVNCLAESFERSADGLQFHFTLKQGIPFHKDYGEVQASDVKYSFERIAGLTKPSLNSPYQGDWATARDRARRRQVLRHDRHEGDLRPHHDHQSVCRWGKWQRRVAKGGREVG